MSHPPRARTRRGRRSGWLLAIVLAALLVRLGGAVVDFGERSLQMDFSAFYTAGQAARSGLSPYVNHIDRDPPIWDGVDTYRHSRFLYPPLVARVFQPFAALPYHQAKHAWMLVCLAALGGALWLAARQVGLQREPYRMLALGVLASAFYPVLTLLERGQSDSVTLLLLLAAVTGMSARPRRSLAAGALLAVATWLKLHCVFLVPFVLLRRQWRVLGGFVTASVALLLLSFAVDGPHAVLDYAHRELPRIARYGERGTQEMRLPPAIRGPIVAELASGRTTLDGRVYDVEAFSFVLNASAVRTPLGRATWSALRSLGLAVAPGHVSFVFFGACWIGLAMWMRRYGSPEGRDRAAWELTYWQIALVLVLLCAPATWAMGTVWLLPVGALVLRELPHHAARARWLPWLGCAAGLLVAGLPDPIGRAIVWPLGERALDAKYILAELLCLAGLLGLWATYRARLTAATGAASSQPTG